MKSFLYFIQNTPISFTLILYCFCTQISMPAAAQPVHRLSKADRIRRNYYLTLSKIQPVSFMVTKSIPMTKENDQVLHIDNVHVNIVTHTFGISRIKFLIVHDDENTGVTAAYKFMQVNDGSLRYLNFSDTLNTYRFDPNHVFTDEGVHKDIRHFCHGISTAKTIAAVRKFAQRVIALYDPDSLGYIFTLHNNSNGSFNIKSYTKEKKLKKCAARVFINPKMDPDDMVFVTTGYFFNYLKKQHINVILQYSHAPDDGSLSVYAMKRHIPYVNVEVQFGHEAEQLRLIKIASAMINGFIPRSLSGRYDHLLLASR